MSDSKETSKSWWKRLFRKAAQEKASHVEGKTSDDKSSDLVDWLRAVDTLQPVVRNLRNDIDALPSEQLNFNVLGAGTFLLQIDLILIKTRQHFNNYHRRRQEVNLSIKTVKTLFDEVEKYCKQCYVHMLSLHEMLKARAYHDLNHREVINLVHALESDSKCLAQSMYQLNETVLKKDPVYQLFETEIYKTLMDIEHRDQQRKSDYEDAGAKTIRQNANQITDPKMRQLVFQLVTQYETLRRSSILFQSTQATKNIELFKNHLIEFIQDILKERDQVVLEDHVLGIFLSLEAMRFSRTKGLVEKSKAVKRQIKQVLKQSEFGINCLQSLQLSLRDKLSMKHKF